MKAPKIPLTRKQKESLLQRFDEKNSEIDEYGYRIELWCILCLEYDKAGCSGCPANIFHECRLKAVGEGCSAILRVLLGGETVLELSKGIITWNIEEKDEAVDDLRKIREYIRECPEREET